MLLIIQAIISSQKKLTLFYFLKFGLLSTWWSLIASHSFFVLAMGRARDTTFGYEHGERMKKNHHALKWILVYILLECSSHLFNLINIWIWAWGKAEKNHYALKWILVYTLL